MSVIIRLLSFLFAAFLLLAASIAIFGREAGIGVGIGASLFLAAIGFLLTRRRSILRILLLLPVYLLPSALLAVFVAELILKVHDGGLSWFFGGLLAAVLAMAFIHRMADRFWPAGQGPETAETPSIDEGSPERKGDSQ